MAASAELTAEVQSLREELRNGLTSVLAENRGLKRRLANLLQVRNKRARQANSNDRDSAMTHTHAHPQPHHSPDNETANRVDVNTKESNATTLHLSTLTNGGEPLDAQNVRVEVGDGDGDGGGDGAENKPDIDATEECGGLVAAVTIAKT